MRQTLPEPPESRYEVLALFTGSMLGASLVLMSTGTLLPFLEAAFHIGKAQLGLVLSAQLLGAVFTTALCGMLTDRFGDKAVVLWSGIVMGVALMLAGAVHNFVWLIFWLVIYGVAYSAVTPAGSHAIIFFFKKEDRGLAMGLRQCGVPLAGVVGSLLLPAIALRFNYGPALATAGVITFIACASASFLYREPKELQGERVSLRAMLSELIQIARDARLIYLTINGMILLCAQVAVMAFFAITLVHEARYAIPAAVAAFAISQIAAVAGRLSWGWSSDAVFKGSRAIPLAIVCVFTALVAFWVSTITPETPAATIVLIAAVLGFCAEGWFGLGVIALAEVGGEEHSGSALGFALTWMFVAAFIAPLMFGAVAEAQGYVVAWRWLAVFELLGIPPALLASAILRRTAAVEAVR